MTIQPYLSFEGKAEEAAHFYREAVGAEIQFMMRFSESPDPMPPGMVPPGSEDKILHMALKIGDSVVMGSDGRCMGAANFAGFCLSYTVKDADAAKTVFEALSSGGSVQMPLGKTFFSPCFGMATDKFGLPWMVIVQP